MRGGDSGLRAERGAFVEATVLVDEGEHLAVPDEGVLWLDDPLRLRIIFSALTMLLPAYHL